ncbi:MAG: DUF1467 family protein [Geminicoccaceae bacterium]
MSPLGIAVVFVIVWWLIFFMTLPFGVRPPEDREPGHDPGAPERPRIALKMLITTVIAAALTAAAYGIIDAGWISIRPADLSR